MLAYGPGEGGEAQPALALAFDAIELEYAAIRKHAALLDLPHRAVLEVRGADRVEFLNRMVTQELKGIIAGDVRRSFWLNRKGRIDADLTIVHGADATLLDVDVLALGRTLRGLGAYIITEDCAILDAGQRTHRMRLLGPNAWALLRQTCPGEPPDGLASEPLAPRRSATARVRVGDGSARALTLWREDVGPTPCFELLCATDDALAIARALIAAGHDPSHDAVHNSGHDPNMHDPAGVALPQLSSPATSIRLRVIGWHAYNIARLEGGQPLYNLDFGPNSLPAETGVLHDRVSFTKGCYLGQEVVARMHSRGHSKQALVAVRFERGPIGSGDADAYPPVPATGAALLGDGDVPIGTITSAAPSPQHAMAPLAFAQVKHPHPAPGAIVACECEGVRLKGVVLPGLGVLAARGSSIGATSPRPGGAS